MLYVVSLVLLVLSVTDTSATTNRQSLWKAGTNGEYIVNMENVLKSHLQNNKEFVVGKPVARASCATLKCQNGVCREVEKGFAQCICKPGFFISSTDPTKCIDSGCLLTGCKNGRCYKQSNGSFKCQCYPGYKPSTVAKFVCEAIRKKGKVPRCTRCTNGRCADLDGDAVADVCLCNDGFQKHRADPFTCVRKSKPVTSLSVCQRLGRGVCRNGRCVSLGRTYRCICKRGYIPDFGGKRCIRVQKPSWPSSRNLLLGDSGLLSKLLLMHMFFD